VFCRRRRRRVRQGGAEAGAGFAAADGAWPHAASLLVALEDLADAAVRDAQGPADDARSDTARRQLDDPQSDVTRQRSPVDEYAAQLIHSALT